LVPVTDGTGYVLATVPVEVLREQAMTFLVNTALSAGTTVTLPLAGTVDVRIFWGDNTMDVSTASGNFSHTYATEGVYQVTITGSMTSFGGAGVLGAKLIAWTSFGANGLTGLASIVSAVRVAANLTVAPPLLPPTVTDMRAAFQDCTTFNSPNLVGWNTANVTQFDQMFLGCSVFNQNVGGWNVSNATSLGSTFNGCLAFNQNVGGWNVKKSAAFQGMFTMPSSPANAFNQNLGTWRPSRGASFTNFLLNVTLSTANYDALLEGWTDFTGSGWDTGDITAFADPGGGQVTVTTDAAHGYANNHVMRITGTTNYDGSYVISSVTATTFRITATFVATETGTWNATLQSGVTLSGVSAQYSTGAATTARGVLTGAPYNWTISDGGQAP
jgi:surface protein